MRNISIYCFNVFQIISLLAINITLAQDGGPGELPTNFNYSSEINSFIKFPKSPEADAFEAYGNTQVSLYSGTPEIGIPLHILKGREFDLPIKLDYDVTGVKVNQAATNVGLSWNLTIGGRISRIANGKPDDLINNPYSEDNSQLINHYLSDFNFSSPSELETYLYEFMLPVVNGQIDTALDYYSLNAVGINDYIVIDLETHEAKTLMNPRIEVIFNNGTGEWVVTNEDGTKYYFGAKREITHLEGGDDVTTINSYSGNSVTSWLLTKIISKNGLDQYEFDYKLYEWVNNARKLSIGSKTYNEKIMSPGGFSVTQPNFSYSYDKSYTVQQQMPFSVKQNGQFVIKFNYGPREDLGFINSPYQGGNALQEISFLKYATNLTNGIETVSPSDIFKRVVFGYSYFGTLPQGGIPRQYKRLKLDDLTIYGSDISQGKKYSFTYKNPQNVPKIDSYAMDFWGFFNGAYSNTSLIHTTTFGTFSFYGANRNYSHANAITGLLETITYPTGGYTKYEFEQNEVADNSYTAPYTYYVDTPMFNYACGIDAPCELMPPGITDKHPNMTIPIWFVYFGLSSPTDQFFVFNVTTTLMDVTEATQYYFKARGRGLYMIQQIDSCNNPTFIENPECQYSDMLLGYADILPRYYPCLHPTSSLFINSSTSHSFPNEFVAGNLVWGLSDEEMINLPPGKYQVTLWNCDNLSGMEFPTKPLHLDIYKKVPVTVPGHWNYNTDKVEGFRIKAISDFTLPNSTSPAARREFFYNYDFEVNSSGKRLADIPNGAAIYNTQSWHFPQGANPAGFIGAAGITSSVVVNTTQVNEYPFVAYESVFEVSKAADESINGYTQYKYNVGKTGIIYNDLKSFDPVYQNGKLSEKNIFDEVKTIQKSEKFVYEEIPFYELHSMGFQKYHDNQYAYAQSPHYQIFFAWGECDNGLLGAFPGPCGPPEWLSDKAWFDYNLGKYSFVGISQDVHGKYGYLKSKTSTRYFPSEFITSEDYTYGAEPPFMLLNKQRTTSDGFVKEEYTYDDVNFPNNPEKITDIVTSSNYGELAHRNNVFASYGDANFLQKVFTSKNGGTPELRLKIDYDSTSKNITTALRDTGTGTQNDNFDCYVFGYNNMFPVAKIQGLQYSAIDTYLIQAIQNASALAISDTNNAAMLQALSNLRVAYPQALMTTYTYDPAYGVTSQTDPKGNTTYYEYDELGRLKFTRDDDKNILSENSYNYKH